METVVPLIAQHHVVEVPTERVAYRQVKIVVVRSGSIRVFYENNEMIVNPGDVAILPAETRFHAVPAPQATITCIFIDPEYALDKLHSATSSPNPDSPYQPSQTVSIRRT